MIARADITGLVLAGGRGSRMGGADKGLQLFNGQPLALHSLQRLQPQAGHVLLNANRNLPAYQAIGQAFGAPVCADDLADYAGPLAGFLAGLAHCRTPYLMTVPCDTPLLPADLVPRLAAALVREGADLAMAAALSGDERDGRDGPGPHRQPVFCLLRADLRASLQAFTQAGGRKVGAWAAQHASVLVPFDQPGDDPRAFFNANTLAELQALERASSGGRPAEAR